MNRDHKFVNPPLPYSYDALEPYIDAKTMELHHNRHLQTYINNLNSALEAYPEYQRLSLRQLLLRPEFLPASIQTAVKNNAGGIYNHIFFFSSLKNPAQKQPEGALAAHIDADFGSFDAFQKEFIKAALSVFGSGYAWLAVNPYGKLEIITTANQDTPLPLHLCPVLTIDVWEHSYYLKHYNNREDYIKDWFHIIDWDQAEKRFSLCHAQ